MAAESKHHKPLSIKATHLVWCVCALSGLLLGSSLSASTNIVMLTSGERLKGEILAESTDEILVLKSALLGEISLPRSGVACIEAVPSFEGEEQVGAAAMMPMLEQAVVAVPTGEADALAEEETDVYQRILGFTAPDYWEGSLRMGMNISSGDQKWTETALRGDLEIQEPASRNFYRFTGSYTYRETEESGEKYKSTDRYDGTFTYRHSINENWFLQNALAGRVDEVKGIDHEYQDTVGVGYKYKPIEAFEFLLGGGGGMEDYKSKDDDTRNGLNSVVNVFQEMSWQLLARTFVVQKLNYYWNPESTGQYNYVVSAAVRVRLTDLLGFEFSYNQNYDNDIGDGNPQNDAVWRNALIVYF